MAVVHFVRKVPAADGVLVPAKGGLRFTPTARRVIVGAPDIVVLPASFSVQLVDGAADVTLEPTTGAWVWRVDEYCTGTPARTTHVAVPDVAELDDTDLVIVDPATLEPSAAPEPAWVAMAQSTVTTGTVTGDDLILTRTDGTTINAGNVRGPQGLPGAPGADGNALNNTVVALGSSITAGWVDNNWPALMPAALSARNETDLVVINGGVSGDRESWMLARIDALLAQHKPKYVIIETSPNDARADWNVSRTDTMNSLASIVTKVRKTGATPIVATTARFDPARINNATTFPASSLTKAEETNKAVRAMCAANNIRMIDMWDILNTADTVEGLHPNAAGSATWAANVADALTNRYTAPALPAQVTGLTASSADGIVSLTWAAVTSNPPTTDYKVEHKLSTDSVWALTTSTTSGLTSYSKPALPSGTYNFRVSARSWLGDGTPSATATVAVTASTTAVYDSFDRADTTGPLGTPNIGPAWEADTKWGIAGGSAYMSTPTTYDTVIVNAGITDVTVSMKVPADVQGVTSRNPLGLVLRSTSNASAYYVFWFDTAWKLFSYPSYVNVPLTQVATPPTQAGVRGKEVAVKLVGSSFEIYFDGVLTYTATSTTITGGTYVGLCHRLSEGRTEFFKAVTPA